MEKKMIGSKIRCNVGINNSDVIAEVVSQPIKSGENYMIMVHYKQKFKQFYFASNEDITVIERKN